MSFLPKKHFKWREPKDFLKLNDAFERSKLRWWHQPLWVIVVAALLMSNWLIIASLNLTKQSPPFFIALSVSLGGGAFVAYVIPWMISLCPSEIHFYDAFLVRVRGNTHRQVKYSDIASFSWRVRNDFATLVLTRGKRRRELLIGVPSDVSEAAVTQFLLDHGVHPKPQSA